jgi:uncharacterized protein YgbK (DUF1537 family)
MLGCIADDFTGGTDLASTLVRGGMRTVQLIGVPANAAVPDADAIVIALKTRTAEPADAVRESVAALEWLRNAGCEQFIFKYCSTFDSTPRGNIGPVADALADALGVDFAIACPAFPENQRTIYKGHLYVGDVLLNESGMRDHPLTPMTDPNLVRVLQLQTRHRVGLVDSSIVSKGADPLRLAFDTARADGVRYAIVDALDNQDLLTIGGALSRHKLITGGSGIALGLPANFRASGQLQRATRAAELEDVGGHSIVLSGSCSVATNGQVHEWIASRPAFRLDAISLSEGNAQIEQAIEWASERVGTEPVLIYGSATPGIVKEAQARLGVERAGSLMEAALSTIARELVEAAGVRKLVVAGGETSGAVVKALNVSALRIGAPIDPGVPWTIGYGTQPLALALKSGNFGTVDFFGKALACWP